MGDLSGPRLKEMMTMKTKTALIATTLTAFVLLLAPPLAAAHEPNVQPEETPSGPGPDDVVAYLIPTCTEVVQKVQPGRQRNW